MGSQLEVKTGDVREHQGKKFLVLERKSDIYNSPIYNCVMLTDFDLGERARIVASKGDTVELNQNFLRRCKLVSYNPGAAILYAKKENE